MISLIQLLKEVQSGPKALILAGAPGSGKGSILKGLNLNNIPVLNLDDTIKTLSKSEGFTLNQKKANSEDRSKFAKAMAQANKTLKHEQIPSAIKNKSSFILDGTSSSVTNTTNLKNQLEEAGYDVMMLYVYADLEDSLKRNEQRFEKSGGEDRSLYPSPILSTWLSVYENYEDYKQLFGDNLVVVSTSGDEETIKDLEVLIKKYIYPFIPKDSPVKTDKEKQKSKESSQLLNNKIKDFLSSPKTQSIISNSMSKEEAQSKINKFFHG